MLHGLRLFTASLFTLEKDEVSAKHAGIEGGGGKVCERSKQEKYKIFISVPTLSSRSFCTCVQISRDSARALNDRIKIREN